GGESLNHFYARVRGAIENIRSQHASGAILIVGHTVTNQLILRAIFGLTLEQAISIPQPNDGLYLIELDAGNPARLWKMITEVSRDKQTTKDPRGWQSIGKRVVRKNIYFLLVKTTADRKD